uniref:DUF1349 domain-containing protein n=1 Tax=Trepomonas sp. PC1 TaxID=1076344 RepID=A0A146KAS0_9EUKA|eukprot:JAP92616.1 hypothetical protein TPC1_15387 [Trepomonas sp. PC1]
MEQFVWINRPSQFEIVDNKLILQTQQDTDYWSRTHYNFIHKNGPLFIQQVNRDCLFQVHIKAEYKELYDQANAVIYVDDDNWVKIGLENGENGQKFAGCVVTQNGYSDWSTYQINVPNLVDYYVKVEKTGNDFQCSISFDLNEWKQLRIFHLFSNKQVYMGITACSPLKSQFDAIFDGFKFQ